MSTPTLALFMLLSAATILVHSISNASSVGSSMSNGDSQELVNRAEAFCLDPEYPKVTLQPLLETKLGALFADVRGTTRFEASGVARVPATIISSDEAAASGAGFLVVLDDSTDLAVLGTSDLRSSLSPQHSLAKSVNDTHHEVESHFEGVVFNPATGTYLVARETIELPQQQGAGFFPGIWEVKLIPTDEQSANENGGRMLYEVVEECWVNYQMESDNKGFEGLEIIPTRDGQGVLLLGLCEGNHCRDGNAGQEKGNGVIVVSNYTTRLVDGYGVVCVWEPIAEIRLPLTADFEDYSDLAFAPPLSPGGSARLSVVSQQESAVFVAEFDTETLEFTSNGRVYHFPRNDRCEVKYCNVEGIVWLDSVRFVAVSDKAKDGDPYFCLAGDQSIGIFSLPA